jgi:dTDP-4-amino-4,6-dideoxygalactose transaminase
MDLAAKYKLYVVEDAAQAIDSYYTGRDGVKRPLGSIGHLAAFSFHETKNIMAGEGGMLVVNDQKFADRAEIIREKGTNRSKFFRGEVDKYGWVDMGSSFLPSDIIAAFLYAQIENIDEIQRRRKEIWHAYSRLLQPLQDKGIIGLPVIPDFASNNGHMFYITLKDIDARTALIADLKANNIYAVFHYLSLHKSPFYEAKHDGRVLPETDRYTDCILRLPMFYELTEDNIKSISELIINYFV